MHTLNVYEVGDRVMIKGVIDEVKVEGGVHKYQFRDDKASKNTGTWYSESDIVPCPEDKKKEEKGKK